MKWFAPLLALCLFAGAIQAEDPVAEAVPALTEKTQSAETKSAAGDKDAAAQSKLPALSVAVQLTSGTTLTGTLGTADQWTMKTSFGATALPLSSVAGIRMAQEGSAATTVVLHNGDSITGALELTQVQIETEWGKAEINGGHIASVLFTPGLTWTSEKGLGGERWKLVEAKTTSSSTVSSPSGSSSGVSPASFSQPLNSQPTIRSGSSTPVVRPILGP